MSDERPPYANEVLAYVETHIDDLGLLTASLLAVLADPDSYVPSKGQPSGTFNDFVHELILTDASLREVLALPGCPVSRILINGFWSPVWKAARRQGAQVKGREFDVCISFAGHDRAVARKIAERLSTVHAHKVFFDEFETVNLWGEDLFNYLHKIYSSKAHFCVILFSHAYRERAWTMHELRAAQTRMLRDESTYVLPVAIDRDAVPAEFDNVAHWSFAAGDEDRIANAVHEKFSEFLQKYWFSEDEIYSTINQDLIATAILDGYRRGIDARQKASDPGGAQVLKLLAAISSAATDKLSRTSRAVIDLALFSSAPINDAFNEDGDITVFGDAIVRRWMGSHGPLLLSDAGWTEHVAEFSRRWRDDADESFEESS